MTKKLVTFDFWDTLFMDDSDEAKRKDLGLPDKATARRDKIFEAIQSQSKNTSISIEQVQQACINDKAYFKKAWTEQKITPTVSDRLKLIFSELGFEIKSSLFDELVHDIQTMEIHVQPDPLPGIRNALESIKKNHQIGIISDTVFSPGSTLKEILASFNMLEFFDVFVFSDEKGFCKPDPRIFKEAVKDANVSMSEFIHIGDRESNDVVGPKEVGAKAILTTVCEKKRVLDSLASGTVADRVCKNYDDLPVQVEEIFNS